MSTVASKEITESASPAAVQEESVGVRMIGESHAMRRLRHMIRAVAARDASVLIQGESGTGKELVARNIHDISPRGKRGGRFVPVDCTTLRGELFESQMFGHMRGAFTGAERETIGFARAAQGGTLFLDEVGELDAGNQARLLRFLQDRAVVPLGAVDPIMVDVRIVAATHRDLRAMIDRGEFRLDLYFRLCVVTLVAAPLRHRTDDIEPLANHFLKRLARAYEESVKTLEPAALDALKTHHWPGNIRELANAIEHAHLFCDEADRSVIEPDHLPAHVRMSAATTTTALPQSARQTNTAQPSAPAITFEQAQRDAIERALVAASGSQARAAKLLQIDRRRLYRMVDRYALRPLTRKS